MTSPSSKVEVEEIEEVQLVRRIKYQLFWAKVLFMLALSRVFRGKI